MYIANRVYQRVYQRLYVPLALGLMIGPISARRVPTAVVVLAVARVPLLSLVFFLYLNMAATIFSPSPTNFCCTAPMRTLMNVAPDSFAIACTRQRPAHAQSRTTRRGDMLQPINIPGGGWLLAGSNIRASCNTAAVEARCSACLRRPNKDLLTNMTTGRKRKKERKKKKDYWQSRTLHILSYFSLTLSCFGFDDKSLTAVPVVNSFHKKPTYMEHL